MLGRSPGKNGGPQDVPSALNLARIYSLGDGGRDPRCIPPKVACAQLSDKNALSLQPVKHMLFIGYYFAFFFFFERWKLTRMFKCFLKENHVFKQHKMIRAHLNVPFKKIHLNFIADDKHLWTWSKLPSDKDFDQDQSTRPFSKVQRAFSVEPQQWSPGLVSDGGSVLHHPWKRTHQRCLCFTLKSKCHRDLGLKGLFLLKCLLNFSTK